MAVTTLAPMLDLLDTETLDDIVPSQPIPALDRLALLYEHPGPYATVYMATRPSPGDDAAARCWRLLRDDLQAQGATRRMLDAIEARLSLPAPDDTAGIAVLAAADGTTVVEHGEEPPRVDIALVDTLPYAAPLLEWHQRRLPHLVVTVDEHGAEIATFGRDHDTRLDVVDGSIGDLSAPIAALAEARGARLIVVAGPTVTARRLAEKLAVAVPIRCRVVTELDSISVDDLAEAAVRHVSDLAARQTVGYLRELRYLAAHQAAVDGVEESLAALCSGHTDVLLIHDDPADERRVWIGPGPTDISIERRRGWNSHGRLVDAAIRAAVGTGAIVHIVPTTGAQGPAENIAAIDRTHHQGPIT